MALEGQMKSSRCRFQVCCRCVPLVKETQQALQDWGGVAKLHLLVNNAAQTLTDRVRKEERAIRREARLLRAVQEWRICTQGTYKARVRGGGLLLALGGVEQERGLIEERSVNGSATSITDLMAENYSNEVAQPAEPYTTSSWIQSLSEISFEDVISAHPMNTFVPLIVCPEFLPIVGSFQKKR